MRKLILFVLTCMVVLLLLALPSQQLTTMLLRPTLAATTFTVTNTNDSGPGSLRQAILDANSNSGSDLITFSIGSGLQTIVPTALLPEITDPVVIDGTTQPGFTGAPLIELSGTNTPSLPNVALLIVKGGATTIRGLIVNHCKDFCISITTAGGNHIEGNYIGTDATGNQRTNSNGNLIFVNNVPNNVIGGTVPGARNVISGSLSHGISIFGLNATGNVIQGNYIGVNAAGNSRLGNFSGIFLGSSNNTVGGTVPGARNVISANDFGGIIMQVNGTSGNIVQGNYIGTDATGMANLGNTNYGIAIFDSSNNTIGGLTVGARNVISGNGWGIGIAGSSGSPVGNVVQGNYVGVASDGSPLGNRVEGVRVAAAFGTTVGGNVPEAANIIAFNGQTAEVGVGTGVEVLAASGNLVTGNSIFSNGRLGIDLGNDGVTANDPGDGDSGSNNRQNFPVVTSVTKDTNQTTIAGTLNSSPSSTFQINFYANSACDPSGNGEGAIPFGSSSVTTDASGNAAFNVVINSPLGEGKVITATATDQAGNTSEFSTCDSSQTAGSIQFTTRSTRVIEDVGFVTLNLVRSGGTRGTVTVDYVTIDINTVAGEDYVATPGTIVFNDGETNKSFDVLINDDAVAESDETFAVRLRNGSNLDSIGLLNEHVITLQDHNVPPRLSINGVSVSEGDSGTTNATFTVSLSPLTGRQVTVDYFTSAFNATSGVDFQPVSGTLSFNPRVTTQNIVVPVIGDQIDEFTEFFTVILTNPIGAAIETAEGTGEITDNDPPPSVSISDVTVTEGNGSPNTFAQFNLSLSAPSGKVVCVQASTADGTATAGSDYFPQGTGISNPPAIVNFNPGATSATLIVQIIPDATFEPDETFLVNLLPCNANVTVSRSQAVGTILNDDPSVAPSISINDVAVSDGSGPANAVFTVILSTSSSQTVTVKYMTVVGTATPDVDFQSVSGTLTFSPGVTSQNITVPVIPDSLGEGNETFSVNLSEPVNASIADVQALGTISDGPATQNPSLSINDIHIVEGDSGSMSVDFIVTLSNPNSQQVSFSFAAAPGTATTNVDFSNVFGAALFGPGQTTRTISVPIIGDMRDEFDETFFINLSNATNGATFADAQGMATIIDNDAPPTVSINDISMKEGQSGTTAFLMTASLSAASGKPISVDFITADGTASAGSDYVAASGTLNIPPENSSAGINISVNGDTNIEPNETFFVRLSNATNVSSIADAEGTANIVNDDASVQLGLSSYSVSETSNVATLNVTRVGDTSMAATVKYATSDTAGLTACSAVTGKASERCDYVTTIGTLTFASGETTKNLVISLIDDVWVEGDETFAITLSSPTGATLGSTSSATVTITDNDTSSGAANPIDGVEFFIRQMYRDILNRQPDSIGLQNWIDTLGPCPNGGFGEPPTSDCDRLHVARGFFLSDEFLNRGYFAFRFYMVSYNQRPTYAQFIPDMAQVGGPKSPAEEEASKVAYADAFVQRPEFLARYGAQSGQTLANSLLQTAGLPAGSYNAGSQTNGQILRGIAESPAALNRFLTEGIVSILYFGFQRRDPDAIGYQNNLDTLNADPNNLRHMIFIFIYSTEYRGRFGSQ